MIQAYPYFFSLIFCRKSQLSFFAPKISSSASGSIPSIFKLQHIKINNHTVAKNYCYSQPIEALEILIYIYDYLLLHVLVHQNQTYVIEKTQKKIQIDITSSNLMKAWQSALLALGLMTTVIMITQGSTSNQAFDQWKTQFGVKFTPMEEDYRRMIFTKNLVNIEEHNAAGKHTYTLGVNQFTHLTQTEFESMFLNRFYSTQPKSQAKAIKQEPFEVCANDVDWEKDGKVTPVENQGQCDAGYAFCSASLIESFYLFRNIKTSLSKQQILDCSENYTTFGCEGGSRAGTLKFIQEKGLTAQSNYPWRGIKGHCIKQTGEFVPKYTPVEHNGCYEILNGLTAAPMTVAVNAKTWQSYKSGVYDGCQAIPDVNHDIYLIGASANSWRLKNSWGTTWGEYGYIRIKSGNTCGICEKPGFTFKKP